MFTIQMKKVFAGLFILLVALVALFAIIDLAPYLTPRNEKLPDGPVPLIEDKREGSLDRTGEPQGGDAAPIVAGPEDLTLPPAVAPEGSGVPGPLTTGVVETPWTLPTASMPDQPAEAPADAGTGEQPMKIAEPVPVEVFGLLTDTGETKENQILDPQSAQTAMVAPMPRAPRARVPAARHMAKGLADQTITVVPEGTYPFAILLETFDQQASAEHAVALYRRQNLACYWVKVDLDNLGVKYRLFTGYFPSQVAAQTAIARHRLAGKPVKQTVYAARLGIFRDHHELVAAFAKTAAAGVSPYILGTANGSYFLYVGAFYTAGGAENQCRDLAAKGLPCQPVIRSTLPSAAP
jgi:hypothetical protein